METIKVYVVIDASGDYVCHKERADAIELYADEIGGNEPREVIEVELGVQLPKDRVVTVKV